MNADGSGRTQLTRNEVRDENPDWSPDGKRIAFYSERVGNAEIYVMNADGSRLKRVTRDPWYSALPRWRPRG
jgi:TolB protein